MKFTTNPKKLMEIRYGSHRLGLGHQITTMCYALQYCIENDFYPVLKDDHHNAYGKWTDYFEAFWVEKERTKILQHSNGLEVVVNNLNWEENRLGFFGEDFIEIADTIKEIFSTIFVIKESVMHTIEDKINDLHLPDHYSSV